MTILTIAPSEPDRSVVALRCSRSAPPPTSRMGGRPGSIRTSGRSRENPALVSLLGILAFSLDTALCEELA